MRLGFKILILLNISIHEGSDQGLGRARGCREINPGGKKAVRLLRKNRNRSDA
jgi:hypothetical protein